MNSKLLVDKSDYKISWAIGFYFIATTANMTMKTILPIPQGLWGAISLMWGTLIAIYLLRGIKSVVERSKNLLFYSLLFFTLLFVWSFFLISLRGEPTTVVVNQIGIPALIFWIPIGVYACSVKKMQILYDVLVKTSYVLTFLLVLCFLFRNNGVVDGEEADSYNMFFGYSMAFASLFQLNEYYRIKNKKILLLVIVQILLIVLYANRGALLSIAFFIIYKVIFDQKNLIKKTFWIGIIIIIVGLYMAYAEVLASIALDFLSVFNLQSRTLRKMAEATIAQSDARDELRALSLKMIWDRPLFGWGIGGECYTIGHMYGELSGVSHAYSPHNGILQHWLYFGIVFGTLINLWLIVPIFKIHKITDEYIHGIILVACSAYFITTLWSSCDILLKPAVALYVFLYYYYRYPKKVIR